MRRARAALLATLLCVLSAPIQADEAPVPTVTLRIAELLPAPNATLGQREFIEVHNAGNASVDLQGWTLRDAPTASNNTNTYTFGALQLGPGQRIVVWSNGSADGAGPAWSSSPSKTVWNDAGDAATLSDPGGDVHDWVGYGSTTQAAPAGFTMARPPAPPRGRSIQLDAGAWSAGDPTPGLAPGQQGGPVSATVANVAPAVSLQAPASARPGEAFAVRVTVSDGNGGTDVVAWTLRSRDAVHEGNGSFDGDVVVTAPPQAGAWTLVLAASDAAGAQANATASITVRQPRLAVALPHGGALRFPDLRPGDRNVTSLDAFTLRNEGEDPATPLVDVSAFRAGTAEIAVDGNLWVGVTADGATTWIRYLGPLHPLPEMAPGSTATLSLRIGAVPVPAPAGLYGTTFTVVPA